MCHGVIAGLCTVKYAVCTGVAPVVCSPAEMTGDVDPGQEFASICIPARHRVSSSALIMTGDLEQT